MDESTQALERAASEHLVRQFAEPSFDEVQPRAARGDEVHVEAGMFTEPGLDARVFVRAVVVGDEVQVQIGRRLSIDLLEELDPLLMTMPRHAPGDELAPG